MALVSFGWQLDLTLVDAANKKFYRVLNFEAADAAEAATRVGNHLTALAGVSGMAVAGYRYGEKMLETALAFPAGVEGENQAELVFSVVGHPTKTATITIPGALDGAFIAATGPNRDELDIADVGVIGYKNQFTSGVFTISDGETADALLKGKRIHVKSRRG